MPKATVIIATYNWSSVLPYSIASALEQSEQDIEVLVVGDSCTDESEDVVRSIRDPRVEWFNLPERFGHQAGPNNEGIRRARSDTIFYLGHDDLWMPHHVESYMQTFAEGWDLVYGMTASVLRPGDVELATARAAPFRPGMWIPPTGLAHRKSVTARIGEWGNYRTIKLRPEIDLVIRAVKAGFTVGLSPRLTAIKFPAIYRPDVYQTKPFDEQREWLERIRRETDLEPKLLGMILARAGEKDQGYRIVEDATRLAKKVVRRIGKKIGRHRSIKATIDASKELKGSDPRVS